MTYYNSPGYYNPQQQQQYVSPILPQAQLAYSQAYNNDNNVWFICVKSDSEVNDYPVAPNATVRLWNSNRNTFYYKSADSLGRVSLKTFDYSERENAPMVETKETPSIEYATKEDFEKLNKEISEIKDTILDIQTTPDAPKRTRRTN